MKWGEDDFLTTTKHVTTRMRAAPRAFCTPGGMMEELVENSNHDTHTPIPAVWSFLPSTMPREVRTSWGYVPRYRTVDTVPPRICPSS